MIGIIADNVPVIVGNNKFLIIHFFHCLQFFTPNYYTEHNIFNKKQIKILFLYNTYLFHNRKPKSY